MTSTRPDQGADFSSKPVQVGASGDRGFEERLTREILQSERTRMLILAGLSGSLVGRAAELAALLRIAAGAIGISIQGVILFRRIHFHQLHLADHFGGRASVSFNGLEQFSAKLKGGGLDPAMVTGKLAATIKQAAAILGMNDAFLVSSYMFLALAALVWLAEPTHLPSHVTAQEELPEMLAEELGEDVP